MWTFILSTENKRGPLNGSLSVLDLTTELNTYSNNNNYIYSEK